MKTFNSKLIIVLIAVICITILACFDKISGEIAISTIVALAGSYTAYRQITKKKDK